MSAWGSEMDAIVLVIRAALDSLVTLPAVLLPAGALGAEKLARDGGLIQTAELPHVLIFNPHSTEALLDFGQVALATTYQVELWADVSLDTLAGYRDVIRAAVLAAPTLSGAVKRFRLTTSVILENQAADASRRLLAMEFQTLREEG